MATTVDGWREVVAGPGGPVGVGSGWGGSAAWLVATVAIAVLVAVVWLAAGSRRRGRGREAERALRRHDLQGDGRPAGSDGRRPGGGRGERS